MSCYPKYRVITYYQTGNIGQRHEILDCYSLEEARERRNYYIKLDNVKRPELRPTIWEFREVDNKYDYYYLEG